jgi:hypothetical protein
MSGIQRVRIPVRLTVIGVAAALSVAQMDAAWAQGSQCLSVAGPGDLFVEQASQNLGGSPELETGLAADAAITQFIELTCQKSEVRDWLASTCEPSSVTRTLSELRLRLVRDMLQLPERQLLSGQALNAQQTQQLRAIAALFTTVVYLGDLRVLGRALGRQVAAGDRGVLANPCLEGGAVAPLSSKGGASFGGSNLLAQAVPPTKTAAAQDPGGAALGVPPRDAFEVAAAVVQRFAVAQPTADTAALLVERSLRDAGALTPSEAMSPLRVAESKKLAEAAQQFEAMRQQLRAISPSDRAARLSRFSLSALAVVEHAISIATNAQYRLPSSVGSVLQLLIDGDSNRALSALFALLAPGPEPSPVAREAFELGAKLATVRNQEELDRLVDELLLPPWLGGLILDANAGVPLLGSSEFQVDVGGTAGWEAQRWGFWLTFQRNAYFTELGGREFVEAQFHFAGQGWFNFHELEEPFGVSIGADVGVDQFLSDLTVLDATGTVSQELSQVFRGNAMGAVWLRPSHNLVWRTQLGLGLHSEDYSQDLVVAYGPDAGVVSQSQRGTSGDYRVRSLVTWRFWPRILRLGLQGRATYFQLNRTEALLTYDLEDTFVNQNTVTKVARLQAAGRLMLDVEALEIGNWVRPGAYADLEYLRTTDGTDTVALLVPSFGLGLRSHLPQ